MLHFFRDGTQMRLIYTSVISVAQHEYEENGVFYMTHGQHKIIRKVTATVMRFFYSVGVMSPGVVIHSRATLPGSTTLLWGSTLFLDNRTHLPLVTHHPREYWTFSWITLSQEISLNSLSTVKSVLAKPVFHTVCYPGSDPVACSLFSSLDHASDCYLQITDHRLSLTLNFDCCLGICLLDFVLRHVPHLRALSASPLCVSPLCVTVEMLKKTI